ncbi:MAG: hypothetical protein DRI86_07450 [Bacteroidetes bacterium]|nr:MAG: hypothetical protein DRI86_07450 [Bacteroidota bacterium]
MNLKQIEKLIKDNKDLFNDFEVLDDFISSYLYDNKELDDLDDDLHEYTDSLVSVYYHQIVKDWQDNAECRGLAEEEGLLEETRDPYKIMQADLYCFYHQVLSNDFYKLKDLII